jgi:TonB family protein
MKPIAFCIATLFFAVFLQAVSSHGQAVSPTAGAPLKIDAAIGLKNLLVKPELAYPEEARQQHIEGKVELELTVSPQGDVVSERVISGPSELQQATMDAFKKVKYAAFLRNLEPSVALVHAIVTYEKDHVAVGTESQQAGGQGNGGGFGLGTGAPGRQVGNLEILSDTQGVDFGPYLQQLVEPHVRENWYNAIPESARFKHGNLIIEFAITKDGKVTGMKLVATSGDIPLDRAAWTGITASDPFPPLPSEFRGRYLALRFRFSYNPLAFRS